MQLDFHASVSTPAKVVALPVRHARKTAERAGGFPGGNNAIEKRNELCSKRLVQMIANLITNALRYGCGKDACTIAVAVRQEGRMLAIAVRDSGQGIAAEHLPRLTERFYRVDSTRASDDRGTGLGLAIAKHIVERHRGTLDIRSTLGRGTEVIVRLPLA